jgi:hypothetical protein
MKLTSAIFAVAFALVSILPTASFSKGKKPESETESEEPSDNSQIQEEFFNDGTYCSKKCLADDHIQVFKWAAEE